MPTQENGRTEKNHGFAGPVCGRVLIDAEMPPIFFAGLRKQRRGFCPAGEKRP
jgi:hypothetical protein